jgi:predicted nuclease with TOPRIM domain
MSNELMMALIGLVSAVVGAGITKGAELVVSRNTTVSTEGNQIRQELWEQVKELQDKVEKLTSELYKVKEESIEQLRKYREENFDLLQKYKLLELERNQLAARVKTLECQVETLEKTVTNGKTG